MSMLEGVMVAFLSLFSPDADRVADAAPAVTAEAACQAYASEVGRRNCIARHDRFVQLADASPYPAAVTWLAPEDPGMPGRFHTLRAPR